MSLFANAPATAAPPLAFDKTPAIAIALVSLLALTSTSCVDSRRVSFAPATTSSFKVLIATLPAILTPDPFLALSEVGAVSPPVAASSEPPASPEPPEPPLAVATAAEIE